jgi:predicted RNase H-like HicB family nuclease
LESLGAAASGKTPDEALSNVNDIVRMIVQEFIEGGKAVPESPCRIDFERSDFAG